MAINQRDLPIVALAGQTNVGKSSLLNALARQRRSVVAREEHTTRDAVDIVIQHKGHNFRLIDTAGISRSRDEISRQLEAASEVILTRAAAIVMVADHLVAPDQTDIELARRLHGHKKPLLLAINKSDQIRASVPLEQFRRLGIDPMIEVSAKARQNLLGLLDWIVAQIGQSTTPTKTTTRSANSPIKLALIGRPNVGKSSLINLLARGEHSLTDAEAGTTRDMLEREVVHQKQRFILADTAGIRRPGKIGTGVEHFSSLQSRVAIEWADVCALMIDATEPSTKQDQTLAGAIREAGRGLILIVNKVDLLEEMGQTRAEILARLHKDYQFCWWAPVIFISASTGKNKEAIFEQAKIALENNRRKITTTTLNRTLAAITLKHPPASLGVGRARINYVTQSGVSPPTFLLFTNKPTQIHFSYHRFIENELRQRFDFTGTPIKLVFRSKYEQN